MSGGTGNVTGGTGGTTQAGAAGYVTIDNEHADDGRPVPPPSAPGAFFWGSDSAGWRIGNWFLTSDKVHDIGLWPIEPPRAGSTEARRASGQDFASGVVLWVQARTLIRPNLFGAWPPPP